MVYLDADKQTYADLNVTGNVYGEQALCSLFLKAETKIGKSLMLDWIMHPLSDWEEICKRQEAIAWDFLPELPLNEEELDFIEYYLEYREQIRGANILLSCATIIDRLVRYDPNRYVVSRGVKLVFLMLHRLEKWTIAAGGNMPQLLKETADKVQELLHGSELEEVLQQTLDEKARLSNYTRDKYDYLFRCTRVLSIRELLSAVYMFDVCRTAHRVSREKRTNITRRCKLLQIGCQEFAHFFSTSSPAAGIVFELVFSDLSDRKIFGYRMCKHQAAHRCMRIQCPVFSQ